MKPWTAGRLVATLVVSMAVWGVLAGACLTVGSTGIVVRKAPSVRV